MCQCVLTGIVDGCVFTAAAPAEQLGKEKP